MREPYLELTCTDCGCTYGPDQGDCPSCGSANCSYDARTAAEYTDWQREERDREAEGWERRP